ncbi:MAG: hypothetical protein RI936_1101 [Pseudomonadota bacterium]
MRHDMLDTSSHDPTSQSAGLTRALAAILIVLGIASIAYVVQSGTTTAWVGDFFGAASVVKFADARSTDVPARLETPAAAPPSAPVSSQQRDEPTVEDATNPHGG